MAIDIYQHDSPETFRIVLKGDLSEAGTQQLRGAWETAKSILNRKELILEVSDVSAVHPAGVDLLSRMRESGFRISAARRMDCEELGGAASYCPPRLPARFGRARGPSASEDSCFRLRNQHKARRTARECIAQITEDPGTRLPARSTRSSLAATADHGGHLSFRGNAAYGLDEFCPLCRKHVFNLPRFPPHSIAAKFPRRLEAGLRMAEIRHPPTSTVSSGVNRARTHTK